ncbi:DUF1707 and DUF4190 domain-containing protein [Streptomyces sp. BE20]|uniref:DUF1707 and DUF4190 domain-containing protein n=1 Tax=Streptomyces sp. BE20 TaxID=3002525 RepID=UPI002E7A41C4|nr:DUF1707 and DUF4190 domain-containing protein [Streptomyces sp. BE20]
MAVQPWGEPGYGAGGRQPAVSAQAAMRAAHADRERTVDVLKAAFAEGRLTADEYGDRFTAASTAQTYGQLAQLVADLPSGPMVAPAHLAGPVVPPTFLIPQPLPPQRRTNAVAVTSLVLGLLCVPTGGMLGLPAVITGHIGRRQVQERNEEGDGMAVTGLVFGWLSIAFWMLLGVMVVLFGG